MKQIIGFFILCTTIVVGNIVLFGYDLCLKDKVKMIIGFEIFIGSLLLAAYFLTM